MDTLDISSRNAITGLFPLVLLVACLLSLPVSLFLLRLYRRAVIAGMDAGADEPARSPPHERSARPPATALQIIEVDPTGPAGATAGTLAARSRLASGLWRTAAVYGVAGVAYAGVMAAGNLLSDAELKGGWIQTAFLVWTFWWPAVVVALLVAGYDGKRLIQVLGGYAGVLAGLVAAARVPSLVLSWVLLNGPPTMLALTFAMRSIRAVGPMVLALLLILAAGSQSLIWLVASNTSLLAGLVSLGSRLGLNGKSLFLTLILLGILAFAGLGWPLLRWIGRRYEARKVSDQEILVDALFLMFALVQTVGLAFSAPWWFLTGLVAFAAYKASALLGFRLARVSNHPPRSLLLLRVFRLGRRSERLFDRLRRHWLAVGGIRMIAGPDLVAATVEPHQFLEFLAGKLERRFVASTADLKQRVGRLEAGADPDGRYRVSEFFCRRDTWQPCMRTLVGASDAVLMDLRSLSQGNRGSLYELGQLVDSVDLGRVLFLVDDTTDRAVLEGTLKTAWDALAADSPNRDRPKALARLFRVTEASESALLTLCAALLASGPEHPITA